MDINEFVRGVNDPRLKAAISRIENTSEGQKFLKNITPQDKQMLLNRLSGLSANGITSEMLLRQLNNNPNIINQLNSFLNKR